MTYDGFDDYTLAHITGDNGVEVYADVLFDATVAPFDSSVTSEMQNALAEKYQGLLRDFVDKTKPVDTTAVSDDMQMPRPALLEQTGIMSDSYNQKVTMVSRTPMCWTSTAITPWSTAHCLVRSRWRRSMW